MESQAAGTAEGHEVNMDEQMIWQFYYHKGAAMVLGYVRASDEGTALKVACRWCELQGPRYRSPASVTPFILADESILLRKAPAAEEAELPSGVEATTIPNEPRGATIGERIKASFK